MSRLFLEKWRNEEREFFEYFERQWLGVHSNWFEGSAEFTPSTNNGVESHNAAIKRKITLRRRLPFNQFIVSMKQLTREISLQFYNGEREIAMEPNVTRAIRTSAALMCQNKFKSFKAKNSNEEKKVFLVPSTQLDENLSNEAYYRSIAKRQWLSFDEYVVHGHNKFYIVQICVNAVYTESSCTCVCFFKKNICKHIIAVAMQEKIITKIDTANPTLLKKRKTRGRVPQATLALNKS